MALKIFNRYTGHTKPNEFRRPQQPALHFDAVGRIYLSKTAVQLTRLKKGDRVSLAYDDKDPGICYLFEQPSGNKLIQKSNSDRLYFHSMRTSKEILAFLGTYAPAAFNISKHQVQLETYKAWPLFFSINKSNKVRQRKKFVKK